jgi:hypothetical protein
VAEVAYFFPVGGVEALFGGGCAVGSVGRTWFDPAFHLDVAAEIRIEPFFEESFLKAELSIEMEGRLQGTVRVENEASCAEGCRPVERGPAKGFAHSFAAEVGVDGHFGQFIRKLVGLLQGNETGWLIVAGGDKDGALFGEDGFLRLGQYVIVDRFGRDAEMSGEPFPVDLFK